MPHHRVFSDPASGMALQEATASVTAGRASPSVKGGKFLRGRTLPSTLDA
jgi:hypothetical protein